MIDNVEVHISLQGKNVHVGNLHREPRRGYEAVGFAYSEDWLNHPEAFSLEPAFMLAPGTFSPVAAQKMFGAIGDSAPDTWGRQLLRRGERRAAQAEGRPIRTLHELDFLLGVADVARMGALRFRRAEGSEFLAPTPDGVPSIVHIQELFDATQRVLLDDETAEDLRLILAPGSSLGGARPKVSVIDGNNNLVIAKFPKDSDEYSLERWEAIAMELARLAGIQTAQSSLTTVSQRPVFLSRRFDRLNGYRIPFLSAMSMLDMRDGQVGSYPEIADTIVRYGASAEQDLPELFRRMTFNVLVSNVDDHLRNHGFLHNGKNGWSLSPAYDLNPTPADVRERRLTTNITIEDNACDANLLLESAEYFSLSQQSAKAILSEVALATKSWRETALRFDATRREVERMASAFEHSDLERALSFR